MAELLRSKPGLVFKAWWTGHWRRLRGSLSRISGCCGCKCRRLMRLFGLMLFAVLSEASRVTLVSVRRRRYFNTRRPSWATPWGYRLILGILYPHVRIEVRALLSTSSHPRTAWFGSLLGRKYAALASSSSSSSELKSEDVVDKESNPVCRAAP